MVPARNPWTTAGIVLGAMVSLYLVDIALARLERRELAAEAATFFVRAERLSAGQQHDDAIALYRRALTLQRGAQNVRVGLAGALLTTGRADDARSVLDEALSDEPNSAPANLWMARLLRTAGDTDGASAHYHRAIYGQWSGNSDGQPLAARLELIEMLAKANRDRELLSELLLVEEAAQRDVALQARLAALFLQAGAPARAADAYRLVVKSRPEDASAWAGLGDAEVAMGSYRAAQDAYTAALRRGDKSVAERLVRTVNLVQIDPTLRRLSTAERMRRSRIVLTRALGLLQECDRESDLNQRGNQALKARQTDPEDLLALAEDIWRSAEQTCADPAKRDPLLAVVVARLQQQP